MINNKLLKNRLILKQFIYKNRWMTLQISSSNIDNTTDTTNKR
jgi:hypothetical protein